MIVTEAIYDVRESHNCAWTFDTYFKNMVRVLLNLRADPNKADNNGHTPLYYSARRGYTKVVQLLLDFGAQPNKAGERTWTQPGWTPLHGAADFGADIATVQILLDRGAEPNKTDKYGITPLHLAAINGPKEMSQALLNAGADPNMVDDEGMTPLHKAAIWGKRDVYQVLLDGGGDPHRADIFGRIPLSYAGLQGFPQSESCVLI